LVLRRRTRITAVFLAFVLAALSAAQPASARLSSLVVDARTGAVLEQHDADVRNYPASLTKMMTLYLTFEALKTGRLRVNQVLHASAHAAVQSPSKIDLTYGEPITVEQAILALTVKSANDAAVVLAEALGGTERHFADLMTRKAHQLGMNSTVFRNASGLPNPGQMTTARDMATLARAILRDYPQDYHYFDAREFAFRGTVIPTHNHVLVEYPGADGFKTGYIHASGFNIVSSAVREGHRLIGVVLGGETIAERDHEVMSLLDVGFARENVMVAHATPNLSIVSQANAAETVPTLPPAAAPETRATPAPQPPMVTPVIAQTPAPASTGDRPADMSEDTTPADAGRPANWAVQVGAFGRYTLAQWAARKAAQLSPVLHDASVSIGKVKVASGSVYRARFVGLSEEAARSACASLRKRHGECLLVAPGSDRAVAQNQ
jgi:D-alanyl-D-alanine carboxypeptidase